MANDDLNESPRPTMSMAAVVVLVVAAMLSLMGFRLALRLPGGQGIEDVLGWTRPDAVLTAVRHWRGLAGPEPGALVPQRLHVEAAYVLVDTWLFMPLYSVLLLLGARALVRTLAQDDGVAGRSALGEWLRERFFVFAAIAVAALLLIDAVENHGGAGRVGVPSSLFWGCLLAGAALGRALWVAAVDERADRRRAAWWVLLVSFVVGALLAGYGFFGTLVRSACAAPELTNGCESLGSIAHSAKGKVAPMVVGLVLGGWLLWLFGADRLGEDRLKVGEPNLRAGRAALRSGMAAIVWRTRYVLVVLVIFGMLTLGMDQCRDVLLALAHWLPENPDPHAPPVAPGRQRLGMMAMVAVAVALFVHSTWLWSRLACRVRSQRDFVPVPVAAGVADDLPHRLGRFARAWARALSLVPLVCIYALVAYAISDALNAAAALSDDGSHHGNVRRTVEMLVLIGALTVGLGAAFLMMRRVLSLANDRDYYNQAEGLHRLLTGEDEGQRPPLPQSDGTLGSRLRAVLFRVLRRLHDALDWLTPRTLPPLALGLAMLVRFGLAWQPELMSTIPAALVLVTLTLVWWMGVAGALTLAEVRHGRPYGLAVLAAVGLMSMPMLAWTDNHVLPVALAQIDEKVLAALRMQGLLLVGVLATLASALWWLFTSDKVPGAAPGWLLAAPRALRWLAWLWRQPRFTASCAAVMLAVVALRLADRAAVAASPVDQQPVAAPAKLHDAVAEWAGQLPAPAAGEVFLVASEGGGIRSAYWTAQVLLALRDHYPDFDRRTFSLSGASGGAVGIAVYDACLRAVARSADRTTMQDCVRKTFGRIDPLSPLLAAWLFEDALARVLPAPMAVDGQPTLWRCGRPGCGHLSRALGFEREWMRGRLELAEAVSARAHGGAWQPHLLLNSTWVESGELASVSSLLVDYASFPAARDVQARLGSELSLIGGAHVAARFPFINPLAAVQPARGAESGARAAALSPGLPPKGLDGHLADGGYFDNSATAALAPVWRELAATLHDRHVVMVLIRNGQKPPGCENPHVDGPDEKCIVPDRHAMASAADLVQPTLRRNWGLFVDGLGPLVTVLNVSGIGAHGRFAAAAVQAQSAAPAASAASATALTVMPLDQLDKGALVPLGWYLSPTAREVLDAQAGCLRRELGEMSKDLQRLRCD